MKRTEDTRAMSVSAGPEMERLEQVMARLRADQGCPWDREQDLRSLRPYLLEEAFEVLEEMDRTGYGGSWDPLCEELGDLLFQIVFHAQLARERGAFQLADVCRGISDKLVRRHPHVFGEARADTSEQVLANWAQLKAAERKEKTGSEGSVLDGVPTAAPALMRAERLTEKASRVGFDWPDLAGARAKLSEELAELDQAIAKGDRDALEHELGDVLLSVVNVSRFVKTPPEDALRQAIHRFTHRFHAVEEGLRHANVPFGQATLEQLEEHWQRAKASEARIPPPRVERLPPRLQLTLELPRFEASRPWRATLFAHLGWRCEEAKDALRCSDGVLELVFRDAPGATPPASELRFEAPSRDAIQKLRDALATRGLDAGAIEARPDGTFVLAFSDPSGLRWRYATR